MSLGGDALFTKSLEQPALGRLEALSADAYADDADGLTAKTEAHHVCRFSFHMRRRDDPSAGRTTIAGSSSRPVGSLMLRRSAPRPLLCRFGPVARRGAWRSTNAE